MPTVLRLGSLRVVIYPNDHRPAHVHVIGQGCEAVFVLRHGSALVRENYGFAHRDLARMEGQLAEHFALLLKAWKGIHGID